MISENHRESFMSNTIGQFDFAISRMHREDQLPSPPAVVLTLQRFGRRDDGMPAISANLMTDTEIDRHVADLKADLDAVAAQAKKALTEAKAATKAIVDERLAG